MDRDEFTPADFGRVLTFDFPGLAVGVAEDEAGPTGCTVFHLPGGAVQAIDVRGGSPGVVGDYGRTHAVCFAGGSLYGLEAVAGVAAELFAQRGYATDWDKLALASGAIVYDFGGRETAAYPDKALGAAALRVAIPGRFPLGRRGAGRAVTAGKGFAFDRGEAAGQGGAFRAAGGVRVAVFVVVNPVGAVVDRAGHVVCGNRNPETGARESMAADLDRRLAAGAAATPPGGNTTLSLLVTDARLDRTALGLLARMVHSSMARAIQPFHTPEDGDVLFALSTGAVEPPPVGLTGLGVLGSELAWDAVLSAVAGSSEPGA